jgi:hypothetical protein
MLLDEALRGILLEIELIEDPKDVSGLLPVEL